MIGLRLILGIGVMVLAAGTLAAQINAEYRVKGAFLYNFTKFVDWPPDAWSASGGPITVCVLGTSPPGNALAQVGERKTLRGQPLYRHRIQASGTAASCHIRFYGDSESRHILTIRDAVRGRAVLTIGERPRVADRGVVINFKIDSDLRIEVHQAAADEQTLTISSEMKLAERHTEIA